MLMPASPTKFATTTPIRTYFFDPNDDRYLCCCGLMHVEVRPYTRRVQ